MQAVYSWSCSEAELDKLVHELKNKLHRPAVVLLEGEVGAGKTTLAKFFMNSHIGEVSSPTYSLVQEQGDIAHADLYRLEDPLEITHLELELYLQDKNYFLVEWGKDFFEAIQQEVGDEFSYYLLKIDIIDKQKRHYQVHKIS